MANEKLRYSDEELEEFRAIIDEKLKVARLPTRLWKKVVKHRARKKSSRWHSASKSSSWAWRLRSFVFRTRPTASTVRRVS